MRLRDLSTIGAVAVAVGAFAWFAASLFMPLAHDTGTVEYLFVGAPARVFGLSAAGTALLGWILVARLGIPASTFAPLILLALEPLAGIELIRRAPGPFSMLVYVLADLRWWWAVLLLGAVAARIDAAAGRRWSRLGAALFDRLTPSRGLLVADAALFLLVFAWAIGANTHLRFTAVLHGDEVKYLRYCENFYQGLGLEVEHQRSIDDLTLAYTPRLERNLVLAGRAVREELANLAGDVRAVAASGGAFTFNRARYAEEWFIRGKNGDFYQVHNPGLAFVLFPAYFIDRYFISTTPGYQGRLPGELPVTNLFCLFVWSIWSVVVFRFLRAACGSDRLAWVLSATAMLTMPVTAFPFQIYPEAVSGLILFAVARVLLFGRPGRGLALLLGTAAGFLPWLHVRYLVLSVVLYGWGMSALRGRRRAFSAGFVALLAAMSFYAYHLTGSFLPDAMYETQGSYSPWRIRDALQAVAAYPFDRIWGLFAHAPVYLLALPGFIVAGRHQPRSTALSMLLVLALVVPSAGHGFSAAGATPLRHLVAVVPFLMVPLAYTLIAWGELRWVRAAFVLLLIVSLDAGLSYSLHHTKEVGRLVDWNVSGWSPNLLMPWTHAAIWEHSPSNFALFLLWVTLCAVLVVLPVFVGEGLRRSHSRAPSPESRTPSPEPPARSITLRFALATVAVFVALGTAATALGREWTRVDYYIPAVEARAATVRYAQHFQRRAICYSSLRGQVARDALVPNTVESFLLATSDGRTDRVEVGAGEPVVFKARVAAREGAGWGLLAVDFGDGEATTESDFFGHADLTHVYRTPGNYAAEGAFAGAHSVGSLMVRTIAVSVHPTHVDVDRIVGLPPDPGEGSSASAAILEVSRLGDDLLIRHTGRWRRTETSVLAWDGERWRPMPVDVAVRDAATGAWVGVVCRDPDTHARTDAIVVQWPSAAASLGAPIVLYRADRAR